MGITLTPYKVCPFDCIYCQLGKTTVKAIERRSYLDVQEILTELREFLETVDFKLFPLDYISLSGFGEPTLNIGIAALISQIKKLTPVPVALITNAALFSCPFLLRDIQEVDLVVPSLDAVTQDIFEKIDRPVSTLKIENVINGLIALRKEFKGRIYLEIMLIEGINDGLDYAYKFKEVIKRIMPDKIQLNTPVRVSAEAGLRPPDKEKLLQIKNILGENCEII